MARMVRAQRPHFGLHPRHWYTSAAVRGQSGPALTQALTWPSDKTLHEHTIMADATAPRGPSVHGPKGGDSELKPPSAELKSPTQTLERLKISGFQGVIRICHTESKRLARGV